MQRIRGCTALVLSVAILATVGIDPPTARSAAAITPLDEHASLQDPRLPEDERATFETTLGYAMPPLDTLRWPAGAAPSAAELDGKVVILQSWTRKTALGRNAVGRLEAALRRVENRDDVVVIAVHTPEGAEQADMYLERRPMDVPVGVDQAGAFCDEIGFWQRPATVVVDRSGAIRVAGARLDKLAGVVEELLAEPVAEAAPEPLPSRDERTGAVGDAPATASGTGDYPPIEGSVGNATDLRGKRGPAIQVQKWMSSRPDTSGKVVVAEFWATWCPPCIAGIPHLNELQAEFRDSVVVMGISDEDEGKVGQFMRDPKRPKMQYAVAIDPQRRMYNAHSSRGIPHCFVMSPDGVVRWQGHPARLDSDTLGQIVEASGAGSGSGGGAGSGSGKRWVTGS